MIINSRPIFDRLRTQWCGEFRTYESKTVHCTMRVENTEIYILYKEPDAVAKIKSKRLKAISHVIRVCPDFAIKTATNEFPKG